MQEGCVWCTSAVCDAGVLLVLQVMQECFEEKDIEKLQKVIEEMPKAEAEYHMKRCVNSGLWVPDAGKAGGEKEDLDSEEDDYEDARQGDEKEGEGSTSEVAK